MARLVIVLGLLVLACSDEGLTEPSWSERPMFDVDSIPSDSVRTDAYVTLVGAGDVHAACDAGHGSAATAALVAADAGALAYTIGDNAGHDGTAAEFRCYERTWGAFKARTRLAIGNHERRVDYGATAYYDYGNGVGVDSGRVGKRGKGYYAFNHGGWRILVLNSEQNQLAQAEWIRADLAANPRLCQLAIWHKPLFTSGSTVLPYGGVRPMWKALYGGGADVILNAHDHTYQRNALVKWDGTRDSAGIRQFIVGTGGGVLGRLAAVRLPFSEKLLIAHGVLRLKLYSNRYDWQFVDIKGVVRDSGSTPCHLSTGGA